MSLLGFFYLFAFCLFLYRDLVFEYKHLVCISLLVGLSRIECQMLMYLRIGTLGAGSISEDCGIVKRWDFTRGSQ